MGNTSRTTNTNTFFAIGPLRMMSATADRSAEAYTPQLGSVQHYCRKIRPETSGASLVEKLRPQFGLPGMSLLQFTFGNHPQGPSFRPHNYSRDLVACTGGHDNDTTVGWWSSSGKGDSTRTPEDVRKEHDFARAYLHFDDDSEINWVMIRAVEASVADVAIVPLQDVVGLGSMARMNLPGTVIGNWKWRYRPGALSGELSARLRSLVTLCDR